VATGTALALARLAHRYGVTNREMLEHLVTAADAESVAKLGQKAQARENAR